MYVKCLQESMANGLKVVGRAVGSRNTLPVLSHVRIETREGRIQLTATDLELSVTCRIGAKVEEEGATTLPARLLTDFVNSLPHEVMEMRLDENTQTMAIECERFKANVKGIPAQEFPLVLEPEGEPLVRMKPDALRRAISHVAFAAASDESRPILTGVLAQFDGDRLTMAAADGFRLSVYTEKLAQAVSKPVEVIIPARAVLELARISGGKEDDVEMFVSATNNQVLFHMPDIDMVSQLVTGKFPDYTQIVPNSHSTRTTVDRAEWLAATRVAHLFAGDAANILRLNIEPGEEFSQGLLTMEAVSAELGDNTNRLDATVSGEGIEIAFNSLYLIEALAVMDNGQVMLETTVPSSPAVLRPAGEAADDFVHVLMPMHLDAPGVSAIRNHGA